MTTTWIAPALAAALLLAGCSTKQEAVEIPVVTPTYPPGVTPLPPRPKETTPTPTPFVTPSMSPKEAAALAEKTYRTGFDEMGRLEFAGGADEPTQVLKDHVGGSYLDGLNTFLQNQKQEGYRIGGDPPTTRVVATPGTDSSGGVDPRFTLTVCEDTGGSWREDVSGRRPRGLAQGQIFFGWVDGRLKAIAAETQGVEQCTI